MPHPQVTVTQKLFDTAFEYGRENPSQVWGRDHLGHAYSSCHYNPCEFPMRVLDALQWSGDLTEIETTVLGQMKREVVEGIIDEGLRLGKDEAEEAIKIVMAKQRADYLQFVSEKGGL